MERARQIGWDRVIAGVHYPSDIAAGRVLGLAIGEDMLASPDFKAELAKVKANWIRPGAPVPAHLRLDRCRCSGFTAKLAFQSGSSFIRSGQTLGPEMILFRFFLETSGKYSMIHSNFIGIHPVRKLPIQSVLNRQGIDKGNDHERGQQFRGAQPVPFILTELAKDSWPEWTPSARLGANLKTDETAESTKAF